MLGWVVIDYETRSNADLLKIGAWKYAECPTTDVLCLRLRDHDGNREEWLPGMPCPKLWREGLAKGWMFLAHNAGFEKAITRTIQVPMLGWPDIPNVQWHDTAASCAMKALPHSLEPAALILRLPVQKDTEGNKLTLSLSKADKKGRLPEVTPQILDRVSLYCSDDVNAQTELHLRLGFLPPDERQFWLYDQAMNERGVGIDLELVRVSQQVVERATLPLLKEFTDITGIAKVGSPKFKDWLHSKGVHLDNLQAETIAEALGDDTDDETILEDQYEDNPPMRALRIRSLIASAAVKKLPALKRVTCHDGRARGLFKWHGTTPGRGAGQLIQPQNFPRGTVELDDIDSKGKPYKRKPTAEELVPALMTGDPEYLEMLFGWPPIAIVGSSLRHMIIAERGKQLISGDYAGIQARVVLALAGQHDKAAMMAAGLDVYCDMASKIFKHEVNKKEHPEKRQAGKNSVLGCGFGMGRHTFQVKYAKKQPLSFAEQCVNAYRNEWAPMVPKLWRGLEEAATRTVWDGTPHEFNGIEYRMEDGWLTARSPAGTKIWYRNPQKTRRAMPWDENDIRPGFKFNTWKNKHWIEKDAFGGLLTENMVMRIEVDIKNAGICNLESAGYPIVLDVHDELVAELRGPDPKTFSQCLLDIPNWVNEYLIPVAIDEPWIAERYRK